MKTTFSIVLILATLMGIGQDVSITPIPDQSVTQISDKKIEKINFDQFFTDKTLRIDYLLAGNDIETNVYLWQLKEEPLWGGPHRNLIDPWNSGNYRFSLYDSVSGRLLFRKGFSSLFEEFQGTAEAKEVPRAYPMTATMPFPIAPVRFEIDKRNYNTGEFEKLFSMAVDPNNYFILHEAIDSLVVTPLSDPGKPATQVDIAFLAEGYTVKEMPKFLEDARRIMEYFLSFEPFSEYRDKITFWAIESASAGSGVDIPEKREYVNTGFNSSFSTFDSDRYLTTPDTWSMRDLSLIHI